MSTWLLAVDESGQFPERGDDDDVIAGLLVRGDATTWDPWRDELARRMPSVPWPPHGAHDRYPLALRALAAEHPRVRREGWYADAVATLAAALDDRDDDALAAARADMRRGRRVASLPMPLLQRLDPWLERREPEAAEVVRQLANLETEGFAAALTELAQEADAVLIFARARTEDDGPPDGADTLRGGIARTRYVRAVETIVGRTMELVAEPGWSVSLELMIADRDLTIPALDVRVPLHPWVVFAIANAARGPHGRHVDAGARRVWRMDDDAHPALILADHLARKVRRAVRRADDGEDLHARLSSTGARGLAAAPLPLRATTAWSDDPLPSAAADGLARMAIEAAARGVEVEIVPSPQWNHEQTLAWRRALGAA